MQDNEIKIQPSCEDELNIGLLSVAEARQRILDAVEPVRDVEVHEAVGIRA